MSSGNDCCTFFNTCKLCKTKRTTRHFCMTIDCLTRSKIYYLISYNNRNYYKQYTTNKKDNEKLSSLSCFFFLGDTKIIT